MDKFSDILKEIIEPDNVSVSSIQYHDELNPLIWDGNDKMKDDVRKVLLQNTKRFIEFSDLENLKFDDVILTGSMANFNYNDDSDMDVHILLEFDQISENEEFVKEFLNLKKTIWNDKLIIQVKGHDVEMYYQNSKEAHHSTGTYSIIKNEWVTKPTSKIIDINTSNIQAKVSDYMNTIDELSKISDSKTFLDKYNKVKDKIKKMRQGGLEKEGEYSSENLAFKVLRNNGYMEKLIELKNAFLTKELSLDEKLKR